MRTFRRNVGRAIVWIPVIAAGALLPPAAEAQNAADRKWSIELYGGMSAGSASSKGTPVDSFPAGAPFTTQSGQQSRAVSSWYFGDGAALLNQVLTQFQAATGTTFPRIASLDSVLRTNGSSLGQGGTFGLRIGRSLSTRLALELNIERSAAKLDLSDELLDGLEAGAESFKESFEALLGSAPVTTINVTSSVTKRDVSNAQLRFGGALKYTVYSGSRIGAYLTGGGGMIRNTGDSPQAILNGRYTFRLFGSFPIDESDRVVVSVNPQKSSAMGMAGGGLTYDFSASSGLRLDARILFSSAKAVTTMSAAPGVVVVAPTNYLSTVETFSPALQFSTQAGIRTTLSGPNSNYTLFTGSGLSTQAQVTLGIFKRF
jgi:hypothetical protein